MFDFLPIIAILFSIILLNISYIKLNGEATTICGVLTSVAVYLCVIPLLVYFSGNKELQETSFRSIKSDEYSYCVAYASIIIFILFLVIGYHRKRHNKLIFDKEKYVHLGKGIGIASFVIGGISFILYAQSFGGIFELLVKAEYLRSFSTDKANVVNGWTYILVIPARLISISPYFIILAKSSFKNISAYNILIILSFVGSILFYLSDAGKTGVLIFGMSFFVPLISYVFKHKWLITIVTACICLQIVSYLDALFVYLASGNFLIETGESDLAYLSQFAYPFENLLNLDNIANQSGFRYGKDFVTGVLNIIPGINFEPSYVPTSFFYGGSKWKITGGVPNDAITFGYLQFGLLGVALVGFILGYVCSRVDESMKLLKNTFANRVIKCTLIVMYFQLFVSADIVTIARNKFGLVLLSALLIVSTKQYEAHRTHRELMPIIQ